ncbi:MAG: hypothetical protein KDD99_13710, partial [Bacteroidetes bacterium]|nr:hypothetical protein [Bacteroidota bacterium]
MDKKLTYNLFFIGLVFYCIYLLGLEFPSPLWGVHFPAFLSDSGKYAIFILAGVLVILDVFPGFSLWRKLSNLNLAKNQKHFFTIGIVILSGILFTYFPVFKDTYGDAEFIPGNLDYRITKWDSRLLTDFFRMNFIHPKVGIDTVSSLTNLTAYLTGMTAAKALLTLNTFCGMGLVYLWIRLVDYFIQDNIIKWATWLMGLTAPCMQMYFGHYEFYAPVYLAMLSFLACLVFYLQTHKKVYLWWLIPLFFINIKSHITSYLLIIPLAMAFMYEFWPDFRERLSWKRITLYGLLPMFLLGLVLYFFVLESYDGPRGYTDQTLEKALFLPLFTFEPPPLDRYNLFSSSHLTDYVNLLFIWSPVALLLLVCAILCYRKRITWSNHLLMFTGLVSIIYAGAFFVLNPLLSMMIDWDLFSIPAPILWVFVLLLYASIEKTSSPHISLGAILALSLFSITSFWVNAHQTSLSRRYKFIGKREFKTYWIGSSTTILNSLKL